MKPSLFNFELLTVYQKSLALSKTIYQITQTWPKEHMFGITSQLRRAVMSIPLNIAEGSSKTIKDYCHFLSIARGSCFECIPLIDLGESLQLITAPQKQQLRQQLQEIAQMLSSLRTNLAQKSKM